MITLLTGQPGNGKTSKIINEIRKDLAQGRTVYTVGIPKLKLPVIELTRAQVMLWHERTEVLPAEKNSVVDTFTPDVKRDYQLAIQSTQLKVTDEFLEAYHKTDEVEPVYVLNNIVEGAKIYVDEAQKGFEPSGVKVPEHISYLSEHRHHGLDFVFISQFPFLIHQTIRALVTIHWHIRSTWKGRKIHEYPEWQERPQSQSALAMASTESYSVDPSTFKEYESASIHTVVSHKRPFYVYVVMASFILLPVFAYFSVSRIYAKTQKKPDTELTAKVKNNEPVSKFSNNVIKTNQPVDAPAEIIKPVFENVQLVSTQYDWSEIAACVEFKNKCTCYGDEAQKLVVPDSVCKAAVVNGWSGRNKKTNTTSLAQQGGGARDDNAASNRSDNSQSSERVYPARDVDWDFKNAVGMSSRSSPNNS